MRGRPPKPTNLHVLAGNPGKRARSKDEPKPPIPEGGVQKPDWLQPPPGASEKSFRSRASAVWDEYAPLLESCGLITSVDVDEFARYCCLVAEHRRKPTAFPASKHARLDALAAKFGLTPSDRARLGSAGARGKKQNPFKALAG